MYLNARYFYRKAGELQVVNAPAGSSYQLDSVPLASCIQTIEMSVKEFHLSEKATGFIGLVVAFPLPDRPVSVWLSGTSSDLSIISTTGWVGWRDLIDPKPQFIVSSISNSEHVVIGIRFDGTWATPYAVVDSKEYQALDKLPANYLQKTFSLVYSVIDASLTLAAIDTITITPPDEFDLCRSTAFP